MKNTLLLLLCTSFLNAFGQNFPSARLHTSHGAPISNTQQRITGHTTQRPVNSTVQHHQASDQWNALTSMTDIQVIDSIYIWDWDSLSQTWFIDYRIIDILYSSGFLPEQYIAQYYNGNTWTNDYRYTLAYDANNQITRETEEVWTGDDWEFEYQTLFTYDEHQNLTSETFQSWAGDFWEIGGHQLNTYDTAHHLISLLYQELNIDEYENRYLSLYTYDQDGNRIHELYQYWFDGQWIDNFQTFNTFDHLSNQLFDLVQTYDGTEWINYRQSGFQYDTQNNRTYHLQQAWYGVEWENEFQYYYTYDPANNPATDLEERWNGTDWYTYSTVSYTHDPEQYRISEVYSYYINGGTQASVADSTHYYYHVVTGLTEMSSPVDELIISPNPTTGHFTIDHTEVILAVDVYSMTGALIDHVKSSQDLTCININISGNKPGMYAVHIRTASAVYWTKVMLH